MGITTGALQGMIYAAQNGVSFKKTLTIGRQGLMVPASTFKKMLRKFNTTAPLPPATGYAEELFKFLGAEVRDSLDYSDFEQASVIHDMNLPVPDALKNKYTCVWDGGCLEHVFNYPAAIKNCMDMVEIGGHLIVHTPANNFFGHGFYQFSAELFFSLLTQHNGFANTKVFVSHDRRKYESYAGKYWYEVSSPQALKRRVDERPPFGSAASMMIFVVSKKIAAVPDALQVMQSDYVEAWNGNSRSKSLSPLQKMVKICVKFSRLARKILRIYVRAKKVRLFYRRIKGFPFSM
jgi:hypothetical protein